ncbi:MAG: phosphatase PAP2 family protein [Candidatus Saccharimonadales bacterium]
MLTRFLADGTLVVIIIVAAIMVLNYMRSSPKQFFRLLPQLIMAGLTSLLVGKIMSLLYQPSVERPFIERGVAAGAAYIDNPGFPSDHALLAVVIVAAVWFITRNKRVAILLSFTVIVMCVARVVALVHTPIDIIGGIIAGLSGSIWYQKIKTQS